MYTRNRAIIASAGTTIITALLLATFSCNENPADSGTQDGTIADCSFDAAKVFDSAGGPYTFTCDRVYINAPVTIAAGTQVTIKGFFEITQTGSLTIEQGARLSMDESSYIWVHGGRLNINGTQARPVQIKNGQSGKFWGSSDPADGGILIDREANLLSTIAWCQIDSAKNGISCETDKLAITNTTVRRCKNNGMIFYKSGPKDSASFVGNSFLYNGSGTLDYPLIIDVANLTRLPNDVVFTGNSQQAIKVYCQGSSNQVTESGTWRKQAVPYVFSNDYAQLENPSGVTIRIQPGTRLLFQADSYIDVGRGTLIARGTATDSIIFENQVPGARWGWEGGLRFNEYSPANSYLEYCRVSFAKENGLFLDIVPVTVARSTITDSEEYGIYMYLESAKADVDLTTITFRNNGSGDWMVKE